MANGFTIHIFVPNGDPEDVRIVSRMNWTGQGIVFPRSKWPSARNRKELDWPGVYILTGYSDDGDRMTVYIGQGDTVRKRIDDHEAKKDFWNQAVVFISTNNGLNRGHITWLEHSLIDRAAKLQLCKLDNGTIPLEPTLSESEKADTERFLHEILQILPLVGVRALEEPKPVATPHQRSLEIPTQPITYAERDTIVVPARADGFSHVFIGENAWWAIRIGHRMLSKIRYCAAYQTEPISAVTHYAPVDRIEPYGEGGRYRLVFSSPAKELPHAIPLGDAPFHTMQGPRYTTHALLLNAKTISDLFVGAATS